MGAAQLHARLRQFVEQSCTCVHSIYTIGAGAPPEVCCLNCDKILGFVSWAWWEELRAHTELSTLYDAATIKLRAIQQSTWEVFVLNPQTTVQTALVAPNTDLATMLKVMPGHIVWETSDAKDSGQFCAHRFVIEEDPEPGAIPKARCLLCSGVRELSVSELTVIEEAEQAGVVFLKWQDRFEELSNLKSRGREGRRRRRGAHVSKATGGVATQATVPEGYILVKEAAAQLGIAPKKLRRSIRGGMYPGAKVGGRVYCKID